MRVLVVTVVHDPEDARIRYRQMAALREAGHEILYGAPFTAYGRTRPADLCTVDLPRAHGRRRLHALRVARALIRSSAADVDLVLLHDPELLVAAATLPRRDRWRVVWDVHEDTAAALSLKAWLPDAVRPLVRWAVRGTERWADRHVRLLLAEESYTARFDRVHPMVPNSAVVPAEEPPPPGTDRVVYVGALSEARGAHEMVELGRELHGEGVTVHLIGPASGDVADALAAADRRGDVVWHGFVANARALELVEGALAGLSLLHDEPNYAWSRPTKVLEYMSRGLPVVTTANPASADVVDRHGCGVVVPFGDVAAAAAAVRKLRDDRAVRESMAVAGRKAALEHYNWNRDKAAFVTVLEGWGEAPR